MSIFKEVGLTWGGKEYTIKPDKVMGLVEVVEDVITLEELTGAVKRGKLSKAYCVALRYAGCNSVTQEQVYKALYDPEKQKDVGPMVTAILMMMIPPEHLQSSAAPKKPKPRKRARKSASGSSVKRT